MTREEVFTELRSAGYSGALEDMLIEAWSTTSIEDYLFYDLSSASGGLDNFIMGATGISDFGIGSSPTFIVDGSDFIVDGADNIIDGA